MIDRREFVAALGSVLIISPSVLRNLHGSRRIHAVAFDGFAIFDPTR